MLRKSGGESVYEVCVWGEGREAVGRNNDTTA